MNPIRLSAASVRLSSSVAASLGVIEESDQFVSCPVGSIALVINGYGRVLRWLAVEAIGDLPNGLHVAFFSLIKEFAGYHTKALMVCAGIGQFHAKRFGKWLLPAPAVLVSGHSERTKLLSAIGYPLRA